MTDETNDLRLALHFDIHEPIDLVEINDSLSALAVLYKEFVIEQTEDKTKEVTAKLNITSVSNNCISIYFEAIILIAGVPPLTVIYVGYLKSLIKLLSNGKKDAGEELSDAVIPPPTKRQMTLFKKFTKIVKNKKGRSMSVKLKTRKANIAGRTEEENFKTSRDVLPFNISYDDPLKIVEGNKLISETKEIKQQIAPPKAIPSPPKPIITLDGGIIYYKSAVKSFSAKIDRITTTNYNPLTKNANIIGSHALKENFTCTQQEYDKIVSFTKNSK